MAITETEARKRLFPLIKQVNEDRAPVEIISNHGRADLVAADDYESMEETDYLLRSPVNAARLMIAADQVRRGRTLLTKTTDELQAMADEGRPGCGTSPSPPQAYPIKKIDIIDKVRRLRRLGAWPLNPGNSRSSATNSHSSPRRQRNWVSPARCPRLTGRGCESGRRASRSSPFPVAARMSSPPSRRGAARGHCVELSRTHPRGTQDREPTCLLQREGRHRG
jgi:antitoxin YefM